MRSEKQRLYPEASKIQPANCLSHVVVGWMTGALLSFSVMAIAIRGLSGTLSIRLNLTVRAALRACDRLRHHGGAA